MNSELRDILLKRGQLIERIATQRGQMAAAGARLRTPLAVADRGVLAVQYLRSRPVLLVGVAGLVALVVVRQWRIVTVASGAMRLWNFYKSSRAFTARMASRF